MTTRRARNTMLVGLLLALIPVTLPAQNKPDLEIESIHIQEVNQNVQIPVTIRTLDGSFIGVVRIHVHVDGVLQSYDRQVNSDGHPEYSFPFTVARNLSPGYHEIQVDIDPNNNIHEEYENNNSALRTVRIQPAQEITPISVDLSIEDIIRSGGQVEVYINNLGNAPVADPYQFQYKVNYGGSVVRFTQQINAAAGSFDTFIIPGLNLQPGSNRIWLQLDESDAVNKTNPDNNELTRTLFPANSDIKFMPLFFFGHAPNVKINTEESNRQVILKPANVERVGNSKAEIPMVAFVQRMGATPPHYRIEVAVLDNCAPEPKYTNSYSFNQSSTKGYMMLTNHFFVKENELANGHTCDLTVSLYNVITSQFIESQEFSIQFQEFQ